MEDGKQRYCNKCGNPLTDDQLRRLKANETVYCLHCGQELEYFTGEPEDILESVREAFEEAIEDGREVLEEADEEIQEAIDEAKDEIEEAEELMREASQNHSLSKAIKKRGKAIAKADRARAKVIRTIEKAKRRMSKARAKSERIDLTVPKGLKNDWKDLAGKLSVSVSELVRKAMKSLEDNIGNIEKLGDDIERAVKESKIEEIGDQIERKISSKIGNRDVRINLQPEVPKQIDKERIKKRIRGLIKLYKAIPIEKLSQALNKPVKYAENLIYELVDEGIECELDNGICNYPADQEDEVLRILLEFVEKMR